MTEPAGSRSIVRLLARSSGMAGGVRPRPASRFETFRPVTEPVAGHVGGPLPADLPGTAPAGVDGPHLDAAVNPGGRGPAATAARPEAGHTGREPGAAPGTGAVPPDAARAGAAAIGANGARGAAPAESPEPRAPWWPSAVTGAAAQDPPVRQADQGAGAAGVPSFRTDAGGPTDRAPGRVPGQGVRPGHLIPSVPVAAAPAVSPLRNGTAAGRVARSVSPAPTGRPGDGGPTGETTEPAADGIPDAGPAVDALRPARLVGIPSWPRPQGQAPAPAVVEVSIGRVEVRLPAAGPSRSAHSRASAREPVDATQGLEGYLRSRARGELR
jgi:hypothetical protein